MYDVRVGDEVVAIDATRQTRFVANRKYVVESVGIVDGGYLFPDATGKLGISLVGVGPSSGANGLWRAERFRPLAKRSDTLSVESFLTIRDGGFEEPRRRVVGPVKEGV